MIKWTNATFYIPFHSFLASRWWRSPNWTSRQRCHRKFRRCRPQFRCPWNDETIQNRWTGRRRTYKCTREIRAHVEHWTKSWRVLNEILDVALHFGFDSHPDLQIFLWYQSSIITERETVKEGEHHHYHHQQPQNKCTLFSVIV